jgi:hypothetical protein
MERKLCVSAAKYGDKVVLKHLDCLFGSVALMDVRGHQLEVNSLVVDGALEGRGFFIVKFL